jgi:hypothetical protein
MSDMTTESKKFEALHKLYATIGNKAGVDPDLGQLVAALEDDDGDVRKAAVWVLGMMSSRGDVKAKEALDTARIDDDYIVRDAAEVELANPEELVERLTAELIEIGRLESYISSPSEKYDEHHNHKRARRIGEMLDDIPNTWSRRTKPPEDDRGGLELMRRVHSRVALEVRGSARARELESCWGGVGYWRG